MRARSFRSNPHDWVLPVALAIMLVMLHALAPEVRDALRYDRDAVLGSEPWRLVTGHLVHADGAHLAWNLLGLVLVWTLFARDYAPSHWLVILGVSTVATDLGFLLFEPRLEWYVGLSAVLHGCMAAGLVAWLRSTRDPLTWLVALGFAAKLAWEHFAGALPFTEASISVPVIHESHTYGALGGIVAAWWLARRQRARPAPL
jgi:rhomboid family GlyGly-CTERM serine protease